MAEMTIKGAVQNTRNNITDADGYALPPLAANLKEGQIAVNTCETDPCIFFKTSEGKIVKIVSEEKLTKALTEILGNSAAELDTLRELIAQFEGTSGDILPMITDLVRRVDEAESAINTKADKSALNTTNTNLSNHTGNTSNPHGVTYLQVGALAVGGTAADSNKLGNRNSEQFGWQENNWKEVDLNTLTDKTYFGKLYAAKNAPFDSHAFASFGAITHVMQFNGFEGQLKYRTINVDKISAWFSMWHSGNSNNWASDWTAKNLKAINGHFKGTAPTNLIVEREGSDDNNSITFKAANLESYLGVTKGVLKFGTNLDLNTHGKVVYHAGNSNSYSVNWSANQLYLNGGIYANAWTTNKQVINQVGSDTNKALYIGNHTVNNIKLEAISYDNVFVKDSNGKIWNAGNSNKADVNWTCNELGAKYASVGRTEGGNNFVNVFSGDKSIRLWAGGATGLQTDKEVAFVDNNYLAKFTVNMISGDTTTYGGDYNIKTYKSWDGWQRGLVWRNEDGTVLSEITAGGGNGNSLAGINFKIGSNVLSTLLSNGNWGIGTTNPTEKLDVNGNVKSSGLFSSVSGLSVGTWGNTNYAPIYTIRNNTKGELSVVNDTVRIISFNKDAGITSSLNLKGAFVGVNKLDPSESLDVNGNGKFSGNAYVGGNAGFGTNNPIDKVHAVGNVRSTQDFIGANLYLGDGADGGDLRFKPHDSLYHATGLSWRLKDYEYGAFCGLMSNNKDSAERILIGFAGTNNSTPWSSNLGINILPNGNAGFGTKNPTDRVHAVGNIRATEKGIFGGNVESSGSGIFAGDIVAKKSGAVTFSTSDAAAGATRLNDLIDVKLPTNLANKMVLAYDPAQVNSDGSKGGYTFMPSAGTGTGTVSSAEIASLPDHNHNDIGYVSASDERLKENIAPLTGALNILLHFKPKQYTWNAEGNKLGLNDPRAYGLIAQEAAELKDIVDIVRPMNTSEEYLGVDYVKIVPILIAGVQEQHKEIIALNQKLKTIQARANKAYGNETNNADRIVQLEAEIAELKMLINK